MTVYKNNPGVGNEVKRRKEVKITHVVDKLTSTYDGDLSIVPSDVL